MPLVTKWMGKKVYDCAGLVTSMFSNILRTPVTSGASSQWKGDHWALKGTIDTLPHDYVAVLYRESPDSNPMRHTGIYLGDEHVVDARGSNSGVLLSAIGSYPWTHWAIPRGLLSDAELGELKQNLPHTGGGTMTKQARVTGNRLALRASASTAGAVLMRMDTGTVVDILEVVNASWWRVRHNGVVGYAMAQYMTAINAPSPADPSDGGAGQTAPESGLVVHIPCKTREEADMVLRLLKTAYIG